MLFLIQNKKKYYLCTMILPLLLGDISLGQVISIFGIPLVFALFVYFLLRSLIRELHKKNNP